MPESNIHRQEQLKTSIKSNPSLASEFLRLADAVWNDDIAIEHQECLDALPEFVSAELMGRDVAALFPAVKAHLNRCDECAEQYAELLELALAETDEVIKKPNRTPTFDLSFLSPTPTKIPMPDSWRTKVPALAAQLKNLVLTQQVAIGARAATPKLERGQTPDDLLHWTIREDAEQNLVAHISSFDLDLEGLRLRAKAGTWQQDTTLSRVTPDQVGARIIVVLADRARQPIDTVLQIEILDTPQDKAPTV